MCESTEDVEGERIATWAISLAKVQKMGDQFGLHRHDAMAITPAAALVAAWLRAHP